MLGDEDDVLLVVEEGRRSRRLCRCAFQVVTSSEVVQQLLTFSSKTAEAVQHRKEHQEETRNRYNIIVSVSS